MRKHIDKLLCSVGLHVWRDDSDVFGDWSVYLWRDKCQCCNKTRWGHTYS